MEIIFWFSFSLLFYVYFGYPVLVWVLARLFGREPTQGTALPSVTLVIPACNEEAHLEAKLRNSLALDYPKGSLKIVVASNGSTDQTDAIAKRFTSQDVHLESVPDPIGKTAMLNHTVPRLSTELVAFSDASSELEPQALRSLAHHFADPRVGCVSGLYRLKAAGDDLRAEGEGLYWRYETFIKQQESRLHSILGAHGAFYAIRRAAFEPLDPKMINDDYLIPMRIVAGGLRAVYEPKAVAWEREAASIQGERARRRRIAAGNCQQIAALAGLLNPARGWVAFTFFSHKVLRTFAPIALIGLLIGSFLLARPLADWMLSAQAVFYAASAIGYICQRRGHAVRWLSVPMYFTVTNLAMLEGLWNALTRRKTGWERAR